jgi:hypothetical protein
MSITLKFARFKVLKMVFGIVRKVAASLVGRPDFLQTQVYLENIYCEDSM